MDQMGFYEVFPNMNADNDLSTALSDATITKVSTGRSKDDIRIYVTFNTLIPKRRIWKLEKSIKKQFFANNGVSIRILEDFDLSSQYTPKNLISSYNDSILEELEARSALLFNIYKKADLDITEDGNVKVTIEDTVIGREKEHELFDLLHNILCNRCHMSGSIFFEYKEPVKSKYLENAEREIEQRIASITAKTAAVEESEEQPAEEKAEAKANNKSKEKDSKSENQEPEKKFVRPLTKSDDPDIIMGSEIAEDATPMEDINGELLGSIVIKGQLNALEFRETKKGGYFGTGTMTDFTDSISVKFWFSDADQGRELESKLKVGGFYKVQGKLDEDTFSKELTVGRITCIQKIKDFRVVRQDTAVEKRVELHCHTKMSEFDGVSEITSIISRAKDWGHKALAITDHGVVQAFCDADHMKGLGDFKVIYGCEIYLVDDTKRPVVNDRGQSLRDTYVVFDIETTGLNPKRHKIIEIGAVKVVNGEIVDRFSEFVNPQVPISFKTTSLTSITDDDVMNAPLIDEILPRFMEFCEGSILVAHNATFDTGFIRYNCKKLGLPYDYTHVDTMEVARYLHPNMARFNLDAVCKAEKLVNEHHHRAVADAEVTAKIFLRFIEKLENENTTNLTQLNEKSKLTPEQIKKMRAHHCIVLAKNDLGRINLYRLVSESHLNYFARYPRVPKSLLTECREGLIIGSACEAGELYQAIVDGRDDTEIARIANYYDYLEIQPVGNNEFMIHSDKYEEINTVADLQDINKQIVALGEEYKKPVVATCDVHFLDPQDEVYRRIIMANKGFDDADQQAPLYLHSTDEMLDEFAYLGLAKAHEVVIENTNMIADMCEYIHPVRPDKCPPVIEHSEEDLRRICETRAHEVYGPELPEIVSARLERELNSIIGNGYSVMYIIAQKLVWKSNEDGYLVGSRGSVGSSFAATMAGITEVNPLPPHYRCPNCFYVDFDGPEVQEIVNQGLSGVDMPDKICPKCGKPLAKDGFDIPFETFLGFKGDKEPDIDLNFSNEYQSKAHKYTEVIFGEGQTFKAGTVSTLADKNAVGYVLKYFDKRDIRKRRAENERIAKGIEGVKSTTGQHPGGVVVLPNGEDIYSFTPVQHPANKDTDIVTTHFDYHKIDANLLKLDILGHLDPTMIKRLEDLTGINATEIPFDDKDVMSLFQSTKALGITPDDIMGTPLGTLGIPEFGTDFAMQMLVEAKPQYFTDLVRIAGLAHGTDVWLGNAQDLILSGTATITEAICTRDDIMVYLIHKGLDPAESFTIMERVRKGIVAKGKCDEWPTYKEHMQEHGVPDWYIESCEKIKYMFPKAHAAAYVMMAWRVAYCKINYPLAYYAAFFSIRAGGFDYEKCCQGKARCEQEIKNLKAQSDLSATDKDVLIALRLVQEMYARGFDFLPMDLYQSDSRYFKIVDDKILPPFNSLPGMGDKAAEQLQIAASQGKFLSLDDIKDRGKVSQTIIDKMVELGVIKDLPQSNQLSIFDFT
ncbi:PolC-type DNA polymerase III [Pseudobutyrivibrio xylanivorans]|uniref:DNA polymerase III PolC-type n=1 Tax=Pseudobutyrivibrio xylanivorans DSM 14809 TaxID=1123012 RepID=A0A1M6EFQ2_PSEXY|nr:PolC-type DNA polymerase III [Pseudobutyrivibrio xylanivorans]SHI84253.1 DNA polymerase-3 subunit alpha [Pseudobutyrivibrio xylanivorans DSM 14809]